MEATPDETHSSASGDEGPISRILAVIPAYNAENSVACSIDSLQKQDYPMLAIMAVNDGSTDTTLEILQRFHREILVVNNEKNLGLANTVNRAVEFAERHEYDYILVLNDDVALADGHWVSKALTHFKDESVGCVCGEFLLSESSNPTAAEWAFLILGNEMLQEDGIRQIGFSLQKADLFRLRALAEVNGFGSLPNCRFGGEDHITGHKLQNAGYQLLKDSSLKTYLNVGGQERSIGDLLKREWQYGRSVSWAMMNGIAEANPGSSAQFKKKIQYRKLKLLTAVLSALCAIGSLLTTSLLFAAASIQLVQTVRYLFQAKHNDFVSLKNQDQITFAAFGIASDWVYSMAFLYGSLVGLVWRALHGSTSFQRPVPRDIGG